MFCPKCGAQNGEGSVFCASCGTPLSNTPSAPPQQTAPQQPAPGQYYSPQQSVGYAPQQGYQQPQGQQGYYPQPGYGQTQVMTAPKKVNNTMIGIIVVVAAVLIVGLVLFLVLRGGGNPLVGTWTDGSSITINFKNNGIVEVTIGGDKEQSKYVVQGDKFTVTDGDGSVYKYTYEITNEKGKTVLRMVSGNNTLTLYKK